MPNETWTIEEVALIVADYRHMLIQELSGQSYNKAEHNRRLQQQSSRSRGSIERKHQNISAVLRDADCFYIPGYKPLGNYQQLLVKEVSRQLLNDRAFDQTVLQAADKTWLPQMTSDFRDFVVSPPIASQVEEEQATHGQRPVKRDYLAREARNRSLGEAGEIMIVAYERHRLQQLDRNKLADRIEHVAHSRGDGLGYDVLSFEADGRERFIEVKSTGYGKELPFYMSRNEVEFSTAQSTRYYLYRVFGLQKEPHMFSLYGDMREKLRLDPVSFRAGLAGHAVSTA